jgi:hypothetical protein
VTNKICNGALANIMVFADFYVGGFVQSWLSQIG